MTIESTAVTLAAPPVTWSINSPSMRGTMSPAMAAARFVTTATVSITLRVPSNRLTKVQAAAFPATGSPRSGFRDAA